MWYITGIAWKNTGVHYHENVFWSSRLQSPLRTEICVLNKKACLRGRGDQNQFKSTRNFHFASTPCYCWTIWSQRIFNFYSVLTPQTWQCLQWKIVTSNNHFWVGGWPTRFPLVSNIHCDSKYLRVGRVKYLKAWRWSAQQTPHVEDSKRLRLCPLVYSGVADLQNKNIDFRERLRAQ